MVRIALVAILAFLSLTSAAQEQVPPAEPAQAETTAQQPAVIAEPDELVVAMGHDLRTLARVTGIAENLSDSKQVLLAIVDSDIEKLRIPREDGTYRWATLQREEGGKVTDEKTVEQVHTEKELRYVTVTAANGYRVVVTVPHKRGVLAGNNRVWVRNVLVDSTAFDGKTTHQEIPVNQWVNPGDAYGVALPSIGKSVKVTAELGVESGSKKAVAEVAVMQARLVDDPASPYFPAVKRLLQIRQFASEKEINRGYLKNALDEALLALPGELEKRTAEQLAAAEERKRLALSGEPKGAIVIGDATPDVVNELAEISRMLTGTLQEQTDGRARLDTLLTTLKPKPVEPATAPQPKT